MIRNLIFDFGQVLVCYDNTSFLKTIIRDESELPAFEELVCSPEFVRRCDLGIEPFSEIVRDAQRKYPHWKQQLQLYHDHQTDSITCEMPGMRDLLTRLKDKGYRLYGLSNWGSTIYSVIEKFDILQMLDDRIISSEEHMVKPDRAIYNRLCEKFGLSGEVCLFTDDREANVDAAIAAGMQAVLFTDTESFERELMRLGVDCGK